MARFPFPTCASSMKTTVAMFAVSTSKSLHATIGPRDLAKRPKPDFTCLRASRTTPNCAAFSTLRKSARGSSSYEIPPHRHGSTPIFRLYGGGSPFPLPCGYAFGLFHLPAVPAVHQDQTRPPQRGFCPKGRREEARQLKGISPAWTRLPSFLAESL